MNTAFYFIKSYPDPSCKPVMTYFVFLDTLPKPRLPSAVIFSGLREADVEEITNAITDESTRLVNIWGSPGFGKTSTAVETAHKLSDLGYPVYFFNLQGIDTVDRLLYKILTSKFRSNLADIHLTAEDKLISLFTEISRPIILILDNIDDLLTNETNSAKLVSLFLEFLNSNSNINILVTSRELLENMRDQVKGFQNVRIRPLREVSSLNFVRQLLPTFSENIVTRVAETSFHVPLAIKLVFPLIKDTSSNEMANKVLDELDVREHRIEHFEKHMQKLFDVPYERLTLTEKHTLVSLTVFSSAAINKDAAINVASGEKGVTSNAIRSLQTLVKKSLIDEDPNGEHYSIHPLISSFIVDKSNGNDMQYVLHSAKVRFCKYYLLNFERLNDKFLSGLSVQNSAMKDVLLHLRNVMSLALTDEFENCQQHLFHVLSKAEVFLFLVRIAFHNAEDIHRVYELAMKKCKTAYDDLSYLTLFTSYYFQNIAFSLFLTNVRPDIPKDLREKLNLSLRGAAPKFSCYEGISKICNGDVQNGIQQIEMSIGHLQSCSDHLLLKCLFLQVLILYYNNLKESRKALEFKEMAVKVCKEIRNCNLLLINDCGFSCSKSPKEDAGEPLLLFSHLLMRWSVNFCTDEVQRHICNFVYSKQQEQEMQGCSSNYFYQISCYADFLIACLSIKAGQDVLLDETIKFLENSRGKSLTQSDSEQRIGMLSNRLIDMYTLKGISTNTKQACMNVEACRKALDLSFQEFGKEDIKTAECFFNLGLAENGNINHSSALDAFDEAISIISGLSCEHNDFLGNIYREQGKTYLQLYKFRLAVVSFEKALEMMVKTKLNQESKPVADILFWLGRAQSCCKDFISAVVTLERFLEIKLRLFSEKRISSEDVSSSYLFVGTVYHELGRKDECKMCFENALKINSTGCDKLSNALQCIISSSPHFNDLDVDVGRNISVTKSDFPELFPLLSVMVSDNNLHSGKYESGIALLRDALEVKLNVVLELDDTCLYTMVFSYSSIYENLVSEGKSELAQRVADRALQISESQAKFKQPCWIFHSGFWKGRMHYKYKKYAAAIESLECAIQNVTGLHGLNYGVVLEYQCRCLLAEVYTHEERYEDALHSLYQALSLVRNMFPEGSQREAEILLSVGSIARKIKNRKLVINNFRLAYKMFSEVLGENHPQTQECYLTYIQALMN